MLGDTRAALRTCAEGLAIDPDDAELWFRKAVVHRQRGESAEAEACWRRILGLRRPERFASLDMGIYGHLTRRNLAVLAAERGDRTEAAGTGGRCSPNAPATARRWPGSSNTAPGEHVHLTGIHRYPVPPRGWRPQPKRDSRFGWCHRRMEQTVSPVCRGVTKSRPRSAKP